MMLNIKKIKSLPLILLVAISPISLSAEPMNDKTNKNLSILEEKSAGRLGVVILDKNGDAKVSYRQNERFPFASTFKIIVASAILKKSMADETLLSERILYTSKDLVTYSPVTEKNIPNGMTISELVKAMLQYSDNTAANLLIARLGGIVSINNFVKDLGDFDFRLDRIEPALNTAHPNDVRDTASPLSMAKILYEIIFGHTLSDKQKTQLISWLKGNTTGDVSIKAGIPQNWTIGDKTGGAAYGTTNDIAIVWSDNGTPMIVSVYFTQMLPDAPLRKDVVASATRISFSGLGK